MSGCDWQKKKFSVFVSGKNHGMIFGKKSKCCNSYARVEGKTTKYYVCEKCGKACDVK